MDFVQLRRMCHELGTDLLSFVQKFEEGLVHGNEADD